VCFPYEGLSFGGETLVQALELRESDPVRAIVLLLLPIRSVQVSHAVQAKQNAGLGLVPRQQNLRHGVPAVHCLTAEIRAPGIVSHL
jgi:hypothetical protein